jgi:Resolvase, N terminal domain
MVARASQVVLYTRVSSKDQEKEGYSIPSQQRVLREYALQQGMIVAEEFVDVETAKQSGRTAFTAMLEYLKKHRAACRTILAEKTDRLYRNLKDDFGVTVHLVKEGRVIGPDSRSSDHLAHGINVLMARNKTRKVKHYFEYTGLVHCGHCGCLLVGEQKKGKYVCYHCTVQVARNLTDTEWAAMRNSRFFLTCPYIFCLPSQSYLARAMRWTQGIFKRG